MGDREKKFIDCYRKMRLEKGGVDITKDGLALLTAACMLSQAIDDHRNLPPDLNITFQQASAIIDMENNGYSEGLGPETKEACTGWGELLTQAEAITGRTADANLTEDQIEAQEIAEDAAKLAYRKSQGWD